MWGVVAVDKDVTWRCDAAVITITGLTKLKYILRTKSCNYHTLVQTYPLDLGKDSRYKDYRRS